MVAEAKAAEKAPQDEIDVDTASLGLPADADMLDVTEEMTASDDGIWERLAAQKIDAAAEADDLMAGIMHDFWGADATCPPGERGSDKNGGRSCPLPTP